MAPNIVNLAKIGDKLPTPPSALLHPKKAPSISNGLRLDVV
jgi:hypothetical protein